MWLSLCFELPLKYCDTDLAQGCWPTYKNTPCVTWSCASKAHISDTGRWHSKQGGEEEGGTVQSVLGIEGTINFKKISRKSLNNVAEEDKLQAWLLTFAFLFKELFKKRSGLALTWGWLLPLEWWFITLEEGHLKAVSIWEMKALSPSGGWGEDIGNENFHIFLHLGIRSRFKVRIYLRVCKDHMGRRAGIARKNYQK